MSLEGVIEKAISDVLSKIEGLNIRAYLVDDTPGEEVPEPLKYPYVAIALNTVQFVVEGEPLFECTGRIIIATNILNDQKRQQLSNFTDKVRYYLVNTAVDCALPDFVTTAYLSLGQEEPEADENEQMESFALEMYGAAVLPQIGEDANGDVMIDANGDTMWFPG